MTSSNRTSRSLRPLSDLTLPFLDIHGADAFESVHYVEKANWKELDLSVLVKMTLLKIRLGMIVLDEDGTENKIFCSSSMAANPALHHVDRYQIVDSQFHTLHRLVQRRNKHFWSVLLQKDLNRCVITPTVSRTKVVCSRLTSVRVMLGWHFGIM